eukprot:scaffold153454_cov33-Tisochrysis_lutea.AAC.1
MERRAHLSQLCQELNHIRRRHVVQRGRQEEEPILAHAHVVDAIHIEDWGVAFRLLHEFTQEDLG